MEKDDTNFINILYQPLKIQIPEANRMDVLNYTDYFYLRKKDVQKAIAVFNLAVKEYPDEFNIYDSLGDAYQASNETEKAFHTMSQNIPQHCIV